LLIQILCHGYKKYTPTDCFFGDFAHWQRRYTLRQCLAYNAQTIKNSFVAIKWYSK